MKEFQDVEMIIEILATVVRNAIVEERKDEMYGKKASEQNESSNLCES